MTASSLLQTQKKYYPRNLEKLAKIVKGKLTEEDKAILQRIMVIDWEVSHLDLAKPDDRIFAAHALSLGVPVFHGFGNFYALTCHPHIEVIRSVNAAKGRPLDQTASATTTKHFFDGLFNWDKLPSGFTKKQIRTMIDRFYDMGPFGFRGPAAENTLKHMTKEIDGKITLQVIAPGYHCLSNALLEVGLKKAGLTYFAATSPNISSNVTGVEEAAHYKIAGIKKDFGKIAPGFVMLGHTDETKIIEQYPNHDLMSTSIISFDTTIGDSPKVIIERHGSMSMEKMTGILQSLQIDYVIGEKAKKRLLHRTYS